MKKHILVTGANGFIGKSIIEYLVKKNVYVSGLSRNKNYKNKKINIKYIDQIDSKTIWIQYLNNVNTVIHTAGLAKFEDHLNQKIESLFEVNVHGTVNFAEQASKSGVKKFIYLSSIQVHGDITSKYNKFNNNSPYHPKSEYALSKVEAEKGLEKLRKSSKMDIIIIRPPLVYGYGIKSNFLKLINLVSKEKPLPFKLINKNKLSFISLENLNDFIYTCVKHNTLVNSNFVIRDKTLVSTATLIKEIALSMNKEPKLFSVPKTVLRFLAILLNKRKAIKLLTSNLEIDISFAKEKLNWSPKFSLRECLQKMNKKVLG